MYTIQLIELKRTQIPIYFPLCPLGGGGTANIERLKLADIVKLRVAGGCR